MNIEITFLDSFPPLEKLTKDTDLFIQIKTEKYNLRKLVESKQDILIKSIKDQLLLKLLTKDNNILGINTFNPLKYKELFSFDQKPILHWLDFKKEKSNFTNNKNSNFFLYEYIRLKIKITPFIVSNLNLTYEESLNNLNNSNFTINKNRNVNQNMKNTFEKSMDNNSKATTISNNSNAMKKKILNLKKKTKISLNYYPTKQKLKKNNNYNSTRNISFLHRPSKNNTLIPKPSKNGETFYLSSYNNNNNNKRRNILKASASERPDKDTVGANLNDNDKKEEEKKLEKNKLSMYGEQLLLNETDEVLNKNIVNNREISKENIFLYINDNSINDNNNDDNISSSNNKEIFHINSASLLKNKINKKINSKINPFKKNNFSYYAGYVPSYNGGLIQEMNFLPRNHDYTLDNSNIFNIGNHKSLNNLNIVNGLNSLTEPGKSKSNNETTQFNTLKNDFELFYTQKFIQSIKNDVILFEFNLFLKKSISLLYAYNTDFSILSKKSKSLNNSLNYYRKEIKLLKKKKRKLLTMKEDNEFKMKNIELSKESKFAMVEGVKNQNNFKNKILNNMFPNKNENIFKDIDKSLISIIQNLIKTKFNSVVDGRNIQKLKEDQNNGRYKTISGNDDKSGNNLNEVIINYDELNKSVKAREIIGLSTEEKKKKSINENNINKNQNNNAKEGLNKSNKIFKTKSINIKKNEKYNKNNSKYLLQKAKSKRNINKNSITSKLLENQKK